MNDAPFFVCAHKNSDLRWRPASILAKKLQQSYIRNKKGVFFPLLLWGDGTDTPKKQLLSRYTDIILWASDSLQVTTTATAEKTRQARPLLRKYQREYQNCCIVHKPVTPFDQCSYTQATRVWTPALDEMLSGKIGSFVLWLHSHRGLYL